MPADARLLIAGASSCIACPERLRDTPASCDVCLAAWIPQPSVNRPLAATAEHTDMKKQRRPSDETGINLDFLSNFLR